MHDGLDRREGVEVGIRSNLLEIRDVPVVPVEEEAQRCIDNACEDGWV